MFLLQIVQSARRLPFMLLLFPFLICPPVHGGNLLVVSPALSRSLVLQMGRLADLLVLAGHNVTVWIPEMQTFPENGTQLAQQVVRTRGLPNIFMDFLAMDFFGKEIGSYTARQLEDQAMVKYCKELLMRSDEFGELKQAGFDLAFTNFIDLCFTGLIHHFGIERHIFVSTGPIPDGIRSFLGIPSPPSIVPAMQLTSNTPLGPRMNNPWERVSSIWQYALSWYSMASMFQQENALFRRHISPDFPRLEHLASRIDLVLVNDDEFMEPALPTLSKVQHIGGLGIPTSNAPLEPRFRRAVESGTKGAILFSLGSITDTARLNPVKWGNILQAFSQLSDYAFIVRANKEDEFSREFSKNMANVHLFDWLPQTDLLAHPNTRLFISHVGYNSLMEATIFGVPVLAIPLFFDQVRNAKCVEYRGHGRMMDKSVDLLDVGRIQAELVEMLTNTSYKSRTTRLAKLFREKPFRPEQVLLNWTQFVLDNGPMVEMVPESVGMSLVEYFCLDIAVYALAILLLIGWMAWKTLGWAMAQIWSSTKLHLLTARKTRLTKPPRRLAPRRKWWSKKLA